MAHVLEARGRDEGAPSPALWPFQLQTTFNSNIPITLPRLTHFVQSPFTCTSVSDPLTSPFLASKPERSLVKVRAAHFECGLSSLW